MSDLMSIAEKEESLKLSLETFVAEKLNGRYRMTVADPFLAFLLFVNLRGICYPDKPRGEEHREHPYERREQLGYDVGCPIFESNLEHHCRAGGNGYHVAQYLAAWMKDFVFP